MIKPFAISRPLMPSPSMINRLLACFVLIAASVTSVRVAAQAPAERYRNELQPLIEDFVHQQQIPGFAIGVIQDDRLVYAQGLLNFRVADDGPRIVMTAGSDGDWT